MIVNDFYLYIHTTDIIIVFMNTFNIIVHIIYGRCDSSKTGGQIEK